MQSESPFNRLPPVVVGLALMIIGIECVFQLANYGLIGGPRGVGWRLTAIEAYGFSPAVLDRVLVNEDYSFGVLRRFVTYPFLNVQLTQVAFCAALTLALGKFTAEFYGQLKVLLLWVLTSIAGAVVFGLFGEGAYPLLGGFTPVFGLIGAYTYALWLQLGAAGENQIFAFRLIAFLLFLQIVFGLIFGVNKAWVAELTGFVSGFVFATLLAPGGWARFLRRMRQRD